jgi:hypothetical protein
MKKTKKKELADNEIEVWHYSSRKGKVKLVQHFITEWDYAGAAKEIEAAKKAKRRRKAS